jgi:putative heme transporter
VIVLTFCVVLPRQANFGDVWHELRSLDSTWTMALLFAGVVNIATYAPNWMAALPGLRYTQSLEVTMAGTAMSNVAPLGGAVSMTMQYGMLKRWGFAAADASRAMVVTGIWNNLVNFGLPAFALSLLTLRGGRNAVLETAARAGGIAFGVVLVATVMVFRSQAGAVRVGGWVDRLRNQLQRVRRRVDAPLHTNGPQTLGNFRTQSVELIRRRWAALTLTTVAGVMSVFVVLFVVMRGLGVVGVEVSVTEMFAAWSVTRLLNSFPITPGGLGITDVALVSALTSFGGPRDKVVASALLYRGVTWIPPIVLGSIAAFTWRRHLHPAVASAGAADGTRNVS